MLKTRVIPVLLLKNGGLVKTVKFANPTYVGDPINAVKVFNSKNVDELVFLDIVAAKEKRGPNYQMIAQITNECFMPLCYGGGITGVEEMKKVFSLGVEKVAINTAAIARPELVNEAAKVFGNQSVIVSIDARKNFFGKFEVFSHGGTYKTGLEVVEWARRVQNLGAGEIIVNSIDRDGTMQGYDMEMIKTVSTAVSIPVIACGGAGKLEDFSAAVGAGASAVAAGSMFVFYGKNRAVLINYPASEELDKAFGQQ